MRKSLLILVTLLMVVVAAPNAYSDSSPPTFTCNVPCTSVPTAPNVTFPSPTLDITWDTVSVDIPLIFPDAASDAYTWSAAIVDDSVGPGGGFEFTLLDVTTGNFFPGFPPIILAVAPPNASDSGTLSFTSSVAATPEPSSVAFMLIGIGLLFVMWKRIGQGLQQGS
jgi:hypothetical protein